MLWRFSGASKSPAASFILFEWSVTTPRRSATKYRRPKPFN